MLYSNMANWIPVFEHLDMQEGKPCETVKVMEDNKQILWKVTATQAIATLALFFSEVGLTLGYGLCKAVSLLGTSTVTYSLWLLVKMTLDSLNLAYAYHWVWMNISSQIVTLVFGLLAIIGDVRQENGLLNYLSAHFSAFELYPLLWALILLVQMYLLITSIFIISVTFHSALTSDRKFKNTGWLKKIICKRAPNSAKTYSV